MVILYGLEDKCYRNWEYKIKNSWEGFYGRDGNRKNLWRKKVLKNNKKEFCK